MKLNLYVIADQLGNFPQRANITTASADIDGLRIVGKAESAIEARYVYLCFEHEGVRLINNGDEIFIPGRDSAEVTNAVLGAIEKLNAWEEELKKRSSERDLEGILNLGGELLENPLMLSDAAGNVLAMSRAFIAEDINHDRA